MVAIPAGEVHITLGSETFALKCTLDAFRSIPRGLDGFIGAFGKLTQADVDSCVFIIASGTGKGGDFKEHERIAGLLFENGLSGVLTPLSTYLTLLQGGGAKREASGTSGE